MIALQKRALCAIYAGFATRVEPTKAAFEIILAEFSGDTPAIVDCDELGRRRRRRD